MNHSKTINVLIIEDEPTIAQMLKEYLESISSARGSYIFNCIVVGNKKQDSSTTTITEDQLGGYEGVYAFKYPYKYIQNLDNESNSYKEKEWKKEENENVKFDLILLDIMLPLKDGYQILQEIRELDEEIPIILLSAKNIKEDREKGFRLGADDYMTKPYSFQELDHRIRNIIRRREGVTARNQTKNQETHLADKIFDIGGYMFDYLTRTITKNNEEKEEVRLSYKENELLYLLCKGSGDSAIVGQNIGVNRGIVERNHILNKIWRDNSYYKSRSMDVYMSKLRRIFGDNPKVEIITLHGSGYRIVVHDEEKLRIKKSRNQKKTTAAYEQPAYLDPNLIMKEDSNFNPLFDKNNPIGVNNIDPKDPFYNPYFDFDQFPSKKED